MNGLVIVDQRFWSKLC